MNLIGNYDRQPDSLNFDFDNIPDKSEKSRLPTSTRNCAWARLVNSRVIMMKKALMSVLLLHWSYRLSVTGSN